MPYIVHLDADNRATCWAFSPSYTSDTVVYELSGTNLYQEDWNESNLFKIYNAETGTFSADDQTETLLNPPQPDPEPEPEPAPE